jgi:RNA polymerase sigma-70 factor (ECF subfamily)
MKHSCPLPLSSVSTESSANESAPDETAARLRRVIDCHYDLVWRAVRCFGVPDAFAEDEAQRVFCIAARRLDQIAPGAEPAFLFATARRVASDARRAARRRPEAAEWEVDGLYGVFPSTEELVDQRRARQTLDEVLGEMPVELRVVFVLCEIEELTTPEIAATVGIPVGTAASRLRRAREVFRSILRRRMAAGGRAERERGGGGNDR